MSILTQGEYVLPDSTTFMRIQVNPKSKGQFSFKVTIYTSDSDEPKLLKIKGNLNIEPENNSAYQACPSFNQKPVQKTKEQQIQISLIDATTKKNIDGQVLLIQNGLDFFQVPLLKGSWKGKLASGSTYVVAKNNNYKTLDTSLYISKGTKELILPLYPKTKIINNSKTDSTNSDTKTEKGEKVIQTEKIRVEEKKSTNLKFDSIPFTNFDSSYFKPINVVFILDISSSMASYGKIDLLKYSLFKLLEVLRPQDQIGLVTYSNEASVLLKPTSGQEKETILNEIKKLHTSGMTAGMDGIKLGFKQVERHNIKNGINQVILITDGAFNKNNGDYISLIEKFASKGIYFSVVGIKNAERDIPNMKEAALKGNGNYIPINNTENADKNLIEEIRKKTFKGTY